MDFLAGLNPQQRQAVTHVDGPLLILAGAGSGKTRVITHRIAHLIRHHRVHPAAIAAVTFTNKAADEMRERVHHLLGDSPPPAGLTVSTFHSFCVRLLRRDGQRLAELRPGFTRNFTIYDEGEQLAVVKAACRRLGLEEKRFMTYRGVQSRLSHAKNHQESPRDLAASRDEKTRKLAEVFELYEALLRQSNALDFDDLLLETVRLLRHDEAARAAYNRRIVQLLIDEYQDTNRSQYELVRLLTDTHRNLCVVGDEDQSIYGWRGADIRNILDFERDFPDALTIRLEENYRSTKNILECASQLVANNRQRLGKWLWTAAPEGERIGIYEARDAEDEALFIAERIDRLVQQPSDRVAVLYRTNAQSRQIEEALRRSGRPYHVVGGFSFYQRAEIKNALAYLKLIHSPQDSVSLLRIVNTPARGIGKTTLEQLESYALDHNLDLDSALARMLAEQRFPPRAQAALEAFRKLIQDLRGAAASEPLDELLHQVLKRSGYWGVLERDDSPEAEARLENLKELLNAAAEATERKEGIPEFLDHAALVSEADSLDERAQVSLLTLHNAKGLEFPIVFIAGLEQGLFPHSRSMERPEALEEERRLCYVGMTRARQRLFLSWARVRRRWAGDDWEPSDPSQFLRELPAAVTEPLGERPSTVQVDLFAEQHQVRESVRKSVLPGKTYNSLENIAEFFAARGLKAPSQVAAAAGQPKVVAMPRKPGKGLVLGAEVVHPRYGRGTIVRREGEGDATKLTVSFHKHGLVKLIERYASLKTPE